MSPPRIEAAVGTVVLTIVYCDTLYQILVLYVMYFCGVWRIVRLFLSLPVGGFFSQTDIRNQRIKDTGFGSG